MFKTVYICNMQKFLALIVSLVILVQSLGFTLNSIAQLDDFWSHYQEHQQEYGDNLITFLDLHYGSQKMEHEDEHSEHQDLPSQQNYQFQFTYFVEVAYSDNFFEIPALNIQHNFSYSAIFTSLFTINAIEKKGIEGIRVCVGLGLVGVFVLLTIYSFIII